MTLAANTVNVGTVAGDHTGDTGQVPFQKYNAAMIELYTVLGAATGAASQAKLTAAIAAFTALLSGTVPASGDTTAAGKFLLRSDGTWSGTINGPFTVAGGVFTSRGILDDATANAITIAPNGDVSVSATGGGVAFTVAGGVGITQMELTSNNTAAAQDMLVVRVGSTANSIEVGPNLVLEDSAAGTYTALQHSGGQTELWQYNGGAWAQVWKALPSRNMQFNYSIGLFGTVPPAQSTGWGTPTGGVIYPSFGGGSATAAQTAAQVAAIITVLRSFGIVGL